MYDLVNNIDDYPKFLNWCFFASILNKTDKQITALIQINKGAFKQSFTTINVLTKNKRIDMNLKDGVFKNLNGSWIFTELNKNACKVELKLQFNFTSKIMDFTMSPIFTKIVNSQLEAFIKRAKQIYS